MTIINTKQKKSFKEVKIGCLTSIGLIANGTVDQDFQSLIHLSFFLFFNFFYLVVIFENTTKNRINLN